MEENNLTKLVGKIIKSITKPEQLEIEGTDQFNKDSWFDDNYVFEFTDGTVLKMASWDSEGYKSGINLSIE